MEDARHFDPVAWINTPRWQASRLGLSRMVDLLERLGRPQDELRFVHVAGTNGKGSVCAYVASVLQAAGYKVGLFTSPFILCFEERIRVNGENITGEELARAVAAVRPAAAARGGGVQGIILRSSSSWPPWPSSISAPWAAISWCWKWGSGAVGRHQRHRGSRGERDLPHRARPYRFARGYPGRHRRREGPAS